MITSIKQLNKLQQFISNLKKYPNVIYLNPPSWLRIFGIKYRSIGYSYFSQHGQDSFIFNEFFHVFDSGKIPKVFIDVGCNHPVIFSNSYFFERNQNFKVLAIDALSEPLELWGSLRPNSELVNCAVGEASGTIQFDVVKGDYVDTMFSSVTGASEKKTAQYVEKRSIDVLTIDVILRERNITRAAILSLDVEGYELQALRGINFQEFTSFIFIIENNHNYGNGSNEIRDLMIHNGYIYYARVWNLDDIYIHSSLVDEGLVAPK